MPGLWRPFIFGPKAANLNFQLREGLILEIDRIPFEDVTAGLPTKSSKIRALAKAGYARAEIAVLLSIRYQHVRKVLLDAGIIGGLKTVNLEVEKELVEVELSDDTEPVSAEFLLQAGFQLLGNWTQPAPGEILLGVTVPNKPGVYAFNLEGVIVYVGLRNMMHRHGLRRNSI